MPATESCKSPRIDVSTIAYSDAWIRGDALIVLTSHDDPRASNDQAADRWRSLTSLQYRVEKADRTTFTPRGSITCYRLGEVIADRRAFAPQLATRDEKLVAQTPDHLVLQYWRAGGCHGEVGGKPFKLSHGHTVLADNRRPFRLRSTHSETAGIVVPRRLLSKVDSDRFHPRLDPVRDRLSTAWIATLFRRLPSLVPTHEETRSLQWEIISFLNRLLDPSEASDALEGEELDIGIFELARRAIDADLSSPSLSPNGVADRIGVSRATLYRAFEKEGGLMRYIWKQRLAVVTAALSDVLDTRSLTQISAATGFKSISHLSRIFRENYGLSPRDWRSDHRVQICTTEVLTPSSLSRLWTDIGIDRRC